MAPTTLTIDLDRGDAGSGYKLLDSGLYRLLIKKCEIKDGPAGAYLNLELHNERQKLSLWAIVSTSQAARFKMNEFLDALNLPAKGKLRTTELPGKHIWAEVGQVSYTAKPKEGEMVGKTKLKNEVERFVASSEAEKLVELNGPSQQEEYVPVAERTSWADEEDEAEIPEVQQDDIPF